MPALWDYAAWCEVAKPPLAARLAMCMDALSVTWSPRVRILVSGLVLRMMHPVARFRPTAAAVLAESRAGTASPPVFAAGVAPTRVVLSAGMPSPPPLRSGLEDLCRLAPPLSSGRAPRELLYHALVDWRVSSMHHIALALALYRRWDAAADLSSAEQRVRVVVALACLLRGTSGAGMDADLQQAVVRAVHQQDAVALVEAMRDAADADAEPEGPWGERLMRLGTSAADLRWAAALLRQKQMAERAGRAE
jgi:hypothetical protein